MKKAELERDILSIADLYRKAREWDAQARKMKFWEQQARRWACNALSEQAYSRAKRIYDTQIAESVKRLKYARSQAKEVRCLAYRTFGIISKQHQNGGQVGE